MKTTNTFFSLVLAALATLGTALAAPETYSIDPVHSTVGFKIRHLGVSWVTGDFKEFAGQAVFDPENPTASAIEVTVQAASVDTRNEKRDTHLRSADFFDVEKNATLSFKSTKVETLAGNRYRITGDFTLLGVTKPVTFETEVFGPVDGMQGEVRRGGDAEFVLKRSDYGMSKNIGPIGDDVHVTLAFSLIKK